MLIVLALVGVALIGRWFAGLGALKNAKQGRPVAAVNVARVELADMPVTVSAIGTVTPIDTAVVHTQLAGNIVAIRFTEGRAVRAGQIIAQIDPRPFRLTLAQDEATSVVWGMPGAIAQAGLCHKILPLASLAAAALEALRSPRKIAS